MLPADYGNFDKHWRFCRQDNNNGKPPQDWPRELRGFWSSLTNRYRPHFPVDSCRCLFQTSLPSGQQSCKQDKSKCSLNWWLYVLFVQLCEAVTNHPAAHDNCVHINMKYRYIHPNLLKVCWVNLRNLSKILVYIDISSFFLVSVKLVKAENPTDSSSKQC